MGKNEYNIKDALKQWLKESHLNQKFEEARIVDTWGELMGPTISRYTEKVYIKDRILYIKILSAPLRHELHMSKRKIMDLVNEKVGENVVLDVRLL